MISRYQSVQASTCDRNGLLLLLFDKILAELHKARSDNYAGYQASLMKVQLGVMELDRTLNHQIMPELAGSLHNLYVHTLLLVGDALNERDPAPLQRAIYLLTELRDSFEQACRGAAPGVNREALGRVG